MDNDYWEDAIYTDSKIYMVSYIGQIERSKSQEIEIWVALFIPGKGDPGKILADNPKIIDSDKLVLCCPTW